VASEIDPSLARSAGMDVGLLLPGLAALGLLVYLVYSLLYPERF
jgi:K+-transporting ATPase KdpF subunit